jgi:cation diffusion facilitator CzcD-associated flavoprotein CzcO
VPTRRGSKPVRVAIIGGGLAGVATAVKLKRAGTTSISVFERAAGPGGVWWQNTYPGCEVDVHSHAYSYTFMRYDWSRSHASQAEIQRYIEDTIDRYDIRGHLRFNSPVSTVTWNEDRATYTVVGEAEELGEFEIVVSCVGMLSDPKLPDWPGLEAFAGPAFHTSRFEHHHDLTGKRVALVGTGSTACQLGPAIAPLVGKLDLYQREPGYVLAKHVVDFSPQQRERFARRPVLQLVNRLRLFRDAWRSGDALRDGTDRNERVRAHSHATIKKLVKNPETAAHVTPDYPYGCKRPVFTSTYYPMLNRENVEVIPHAVSRVTPDGVVDAAGIERPADVLIMATGFAATDYLASLRVHGRDGRSLHDVWAGEPTAFLGTTVPGFPNFFMLYGPNSNGGWSVIAQLEPQADLVAAVARRLSRGRRQVVDTRPAISGRYNGWVQAGIARKLTALTAGCHNYYFTDTGRNVTQWPHSHITYRLAIRLLSRIGLTFSRHDPRSVPVHCLPTLSASRSSTQPTMPAPGVRP